MMRNQKCHLDLTKSILLSLGLLLHLIFASGCTTDQQGGWKSKGGSNKPIDPPTFSDVTVFSQRESIMVRNIYSQLQQDLLICEESTKIEGQQYTKNYDVIGSMLGFDLQQFHSGFGFREIKTLSHLQDDQLQLLENMAPVDVISSEEHISKVLRLLGSKDAALALELQRIIDSAQITDPAQLPELAPYKVADDGRHCFTANLFDEDFDNQSFINQNLELYNSISAKDQSLLTLYTALNVFSRRFGIIDTELLKDFVFYLHTKDFQIDIEDVSVSPENLTLLVKTFLPEYETKSAAE